MTGLPAMSALVSPSGVKKMLNFIRYRPARALHSALFDVPLSSEAGTGCQYA